MAPSLFFRDGVEDQYFDLTSGWAWQEARWAGRWAKPHELRVYSLSDRIQADAAVTVVSTEEAFLLLQTPPRTGRLLVRCVGQPPHSSDPPSPTWEHLALNLPHIYSLCAIGPSEAAAIRYWAEKRGWDGEVSWVPIGAEVPLIECSPHAYDPPKFLAGQANRQGAAWLGRHVPLKRVKFFLEACALAQVPTTLALLMVTPTTDLAELGEVVNRLKSFQLVTLGVTERRKLLQSVRVVATASHADSQWLPGTEIRACGGVAIAEKGTLIEQSNGDGLMYHDGTVEDLADKLRRIHDDDAYFAQEAVRQHSRFVDRGYSSLKTGKALWAWVEGAMS